ncbi:unnamed protein product [Vitrella brassicaformis CCMP3155]|uniref:3'-5' exonuclease domain-containing protein n=2 Tax=Vitrella brassicaformis TaxID=1169539 RepID=A0A0G4FP64_VITBC|nr:unnamed protein product [Vitrella brassicaformis CCMP3155]|eukprot:CEM16027.1 unnamed protein product [Vitrella brassicaformis CCMP3155]
MRRSIVRLTASLRPGQHHSQQHHQQPPTAGRHKPLFPVDLPPALRRNVEMTKHVRPATPARERFTIHHGAKLYELLPRLCAQGRTEEIAANLIFQALDALEGTEDAEETKQRIEAFQSDVYTSCSLLFEKHHVQPGAELVFGILNPAIFHRISPTIRTGRRARLKRTVLESFARFISLNPDSFQRIDINRLLDVVGPGAFLRLLDDLHLREPVKGGLLQASNIDLLLTFLTSPRRLGRGIQPPRIYEALQLAFLFHPIKSLDEGIGGSPWTLGKLLDLTIRRHSLHALLYFLANLRSFPLLIDALQRLKARSQHTGLLRDAWSFAHALHIEKALAEPHLIPADSVLTMLLKEDYRWLFDPAARPSLPPEGDETAMPRIAGDQQASQEGATATDQATGESEGQSAERPREEQDAFVTDSIRRVTRFGHAERALLRFLHFQRKRQPLRGTRRTDEDTTENAVVASWLAPPGESRQLSARFRAAKDFDPQSKVIHWHAGAQGVRAARRRAMKSGGVAAGGGVGPLELPLPDEKVHFIDTPSELSAVFRFMKEGQVDMVGLDVEWSPPQWASLVQLATPSEVFLLDLNNRSELYRSMEFQLLRWTLTNPHILKVGYQFQIDYQRLCVAMEDVGLLNTLTNFVDLKDPRRETFRVSFPEEPEPIHDVQDLLTQALETHDFSLLQRATDLHQQSLHDAQQQIRVKGTIGGPSADMKVPRSVRDEWYLRRHYPRSIRGSRVMEREREGRLKDHEAEHERLVELGTLSEMCVDFLGGHLDKAPQLSNWNFRPLSDTQRHYAALDAYVLILLEVALRHRGLMPLRILGGDGVTKAIFDPRKGRDGGMDRSLTIRNSEEAVRRTQAENYRWEVSSRPTKALRRIRMSGQKRLPRFITRGELDKMTKEDGDMDSHDEWHQNYEAYVEEDEDNESGEEWGSQGS